MNELKVVHKVRSTEVTKPKNLRGKPKKSWKKFLREDSIRQTYRVVAGVTPVDVFSTVFSIRGMGKVKDLHTLFGSE